MDIKDKEKLEKAKDNTRSEQKKPDFQEIDRNDINNAPKGQVQHEPRKKHGDKKDDVKKSDKSEGQGGLNEVDNLDSQYEIFGPTEFMDPQDLEDSESDYLNQPQSMSRDLGSIYPGRASTREEREAKARERFEQRNRQGEESERRRGYGYGGHSGFEERQNRPGRNEDHTYDRRYLDTERGNYNRHQDYQDRQGYERNRNLEDEYPSDERNRYDYGPDRYNRNGPERYEGRTSPYGRARAWDREEYRREGYGNPWRGSNRYDTEGGGQDYPSARQNDWDEDMTRYRGYEESDYDDRDVRRRRDEGRKPWDNSSSDYDRDYDRRRYTDDSGRFRRREDRNYEQDYDRLGSPRGRRGTEPDDYYPERRSGGGFGKPRRRETDYRGWDEGRYADREEERRRRRNRRDD